MSRCRTPHRTWYLPLFVCALQFLVFPFLGDGNAVGKALACVAFSCLWGLILLARNSLWPVSCFMPLLLLVWAGGLLSALNALDSHQSFVALGYLAAMFLLCVYFTREATKSFRFFNRFLSVILIAGVVAASLGLYEYIQLMLNGPSRTMLIPFLMPPDSSPRIGGMLGQANLFALFISVVLVAFCAHYLHKEPDRAKLSCLRFVPVALVALVLFLTGSRAGIASFCVTVILLGFALQRSGYLARSRRERIEFLKFCVVVSSSFFLAYLMSRGFLFVQESPVAGRFQTIASKGLDIRLLFWGTAVAVFLENPWMGVGLENFKLVSAPYRFEGSEIIGFTDFSLFRYTKWTHNEFLQLLSEGGLVVIIPVIALLMLFLFGIWRYCLRTRVPRDPVFLYSHIFLVPFLLQSNFEWPFRHPSVLALFFAFVGLLLAQYPLRMYRLSARGRIALAVVLLGGITWCSALSADELRLGWFYRNFGEGPASAAKLVALDEVSRSAFTELRALQKAIPHYTKLAMASSSDDFAEDMLLFAERLVELQDLEAHWFNLALLRMRTGDRNGASKAAQRASELSPNHSLAWELIHYLNMLDAADQTGRPLESFFPHSADRKYALPEIFRAGN